jgi:alanyl-tRNA synthetase
VAAPGVPQGGRAVKALPYHDIMTCTDRLYYTDCYLREFDARVTAVRTADGGVRVYLDRSAFYPASGGQPCDRGNLGGAKVLDVIDEGEAIAHVVGHGPESEAVVGAIDWDRRFDHMQQHTGQHVLSAAFEEAAQLKTLSFHLGDEVSTIDLDSTRVGVRQIERAESRANQVVFENRPVEILFRNAAETREMQLRKPTGREGEIRLIRIEDFDLSACGGTHVSRTGAIGTILVRKVERMKDQTRIVFVCGGRALACARADLRILKETGFLLSSDYEHIPHLVRKQSEELRTAVKSIEKLTRKVAEYRARDFWQSTPERDGRRTIRATFGSDEDVEAKMIAHAIAALPSCRALIAVRGQPAVLYFAQSEDGDSDMGSILRKTVEAFAGKGGGTRNFAQGGGLDATQLEQALAYAEGLLVNL